eukprot:TRINITY_DN91089_c0_g1_i1.p1 TRINITY_DN91089_c0_g1~~TRINITY_DN91089_c0_g1_i1.p1  ORF type:complete len:167 (-),score=5.41 TRINITY_DN91089_c0_g1_i1:4-504(-)
MPEPGLPAMSSELFVGWSSCENPDKQGSQRRPMPTIDLGRQHHVTRVILRPLTTVYNCTVYLSHEGGWVTASSQIPKLFAGSDVHVDVNAEGRFVDRTIDATPAESYSSGCVGIGVWVYAPPPSSGDTSSLPVPSPALPHNVSRPRSFDLARASSCSSDERHAIPW